MLVTTEIDKFAASESFSELFSFDSRIAAIKVLKFFICILWSLFIRTDSKPYLEHLIWWYRSQCLLKAFQIVHSCLRLWCERWALIYDFVGDLKEEMDSLEKYHANYFWPVCSLKWLDYWGPSSCYLIIHNTMKKRRLDRK